MLKHENLSTGPRFQMATSHGCTTIGGKLEGVQRGAATGYSGSESVRQLFQQQPLAVRRRTAPPQRQIACQDLGTRRVVNILCRPSRPAQYAASLNSDLGFVPNSRANKAAANLRLEHFVNLSSSILAGSTD